jgi:anti-sigma B factor antagonist
VGLQISTRESGDVTILDLRGRATLGDDSDLLINHLNKLVATGALKLLLNLADLTQLDSSGISAIVGTYVSLSRQAGSLVLLRPRGRVRAVLRVVRLAEIIPTFEDETQALASFRPRGFSAAP